MRRCCVAVPYGETVQRGSCAHFGTRRARCDRSRPPDDAPERAVQLDPAWPEAPTSWTCWPGWACTASRPAATASATPPPTRAGMSGWTGRRSAPLRDPAPVDHACTRNSRSCRASFKIAIQRVKEDGAGHRLARQGLQLTEPAPARWAFASSSAGMGRTPAIRVVAASSCPGSRSRIPEAIVRVVQPLRPARQPVQGPHQDPGQAPASPEFIDAVRRNSPASSRRRPGNPHPEAELASAWRPPPPLLMPAAHDAQAAYADSPGVCPGAEQPPALAHKVAATALPSPHRPRSRSASRPATPPASRDGVRGCAAETASALAKRVTHEQNPGTADGAPVRPASALDRRCRRVWSRRTVGLCPTSPACPGGDLCAALANARHSPSRRQSPSASTTWTGPTTLRRRGAAHERLHLSCGHHHSGHIPASSASTGLAPSGTRSLGGSDGSRQAARPCRARDRPVVRGRRVSIVRL